ncbi:MAG: hypothetical protein V4688_04145 [Pseudomonadota bacterium]
MLDLGSTDFNLAVSSIDASKLEVLSSSLFDEWEAYVDQSLTLPDYSLLLQIEEGSINCWGRIKSTAGALVIGVTAYGGLISGVEIISKQLKATGNFLSDQAMSKFSCAKPDATVKRKGGVPAAIQRLFVRVQSGDLSPVEASILAETILGNDAHEVPGFLENLSNAFRNCPRHPQQAQLPLDEFTEIMPPEVNGSELPKPRTRRAPDLPPPLHYRVEVWRESKRKSKQTKVTVL